jgi:nicotinamidase-related amidase
MLPICITSIDNKFRLIGSIYVAVIFSITIVMLGRIAPVGAPMTILTTPADGKSKFSIAGDLTRRRMVQTSAALTAIEAATMTGNSAAKAAKMEGQMSYAPLDPSATVILFADLQAGIIELSATNELARLRRAVAALAKLAKLFEIPAIVTTAPSQGGAAQVAPEIAAALGELPQYQRNTTDAFLFDPSRKAIMKTGRKTLLVAGVATEIIVQHSALSALALGLSVQVVIDACGGISARTEDAALRRLTQAGVVATSIPSLAGQLACDFSQPKGGKALGVLYEMLAN